jgi:hypothetical protein
LPIPATHRPRNLQNADEHAVPHQLAVIVTFLLIAETVAVETDRNLEIDDLWVLIEPSHLAGLHLTETHALTVGRKSLLPTPTSHLIAGVIDQDLDRHLVTLIDDHDLRVDDLAVPQPAVRQPTTTESGNLTTSKENYRHIQRVH